MRITDVAGDVPVESYDGRDLYFLGAAERASPLWRQPLAGGVPTKLLDGVINAAYDVVERGIYYLDRTASGAGGFLLDPQTTETRLRFFDFASGRSTTIVPNLGTVGIGLSASRDGRTIFFARVDSSADELMLVENFR